MKLKNKRLAIVGGGPGGLTLARLLQLQGASVKVYERDANKDARVQGAPLDMHEHSGLAALRKAGLLETFKASFLPGADKKVLVNERAEIFYSDHDTKAEEAFGAEHFRPEIERGTLRKILLESLQAETVVWDSHFLSMEAQGEGWLLHFKNKPSVYADIVVAADGANSKIRPYITSVKPFYSGITMLEINIDDAQQSTPQMAALAAGGKVMAFGMGKSLMGGQKRGELGYYAGFKADEDWAANSGLHFSDRAQMLDWFGKEYSGWSPVWQELFEGATMPFIPRTIYCAPLDQTWEALPNTTLLGDAAHVMPPFAGEGANMAMLDALELSESLTSDEYATVHEAIAAYESVMRARAAIAAEESLQNGEMMHSEGALGTMLAFFGGH